MSDGTPAGVAIAEVLADALASSLAADGRSSAAEGLAETITTFTPVVASLSESG